MLFYFILSIENVIGETGQSQPPKPDQKPNVVYVMVDDWGWE